MRVTVIATHPEIAPSTRFRAHQYRPHLERIGIELAYDFLFDLDDYRTLRTTTSPLRRGRLLLSALKQRRKRFRAGLDADVGFVSVGLAPLFPSGLLQSLTDVALPLVFDFDDAIFLPQRGGSRIVARLSRPYEAAVALCRAASVVLPGNEFLADFARGALAGRPAEAGKVRVLPTSTLR